MKQSSLSFLRAVWFTSEPRAAFSQSETVSQRIRARLENVKWVTRGLQMRFWNSNKIWQRFGWENIWELAKKKSQNFPPFNYFKKGFTFDISNVFHTYAFETIIQLLISEQWFFLYKSTWPYSKGLNNLKPNPNILFHVKQNVWTWPKMKRLSVCLASFFFPFLFW